MAYIGLKIISAMGPVRGLTITGIILRRPKKTFVVLYVHLVYFTYFQTSEMERKVH